MKFFKFLLSLLFVAHCYATNNNLDNVLLIINYNHAHYESIPLIKQMYGDYFKNIVFYGPERTFCSATKYEYPEIEYLDHNMGYVSYLSIAKAMEKYPDFDGYLFLMDDCILNAWFLKDMKDLDITKIWLPCCEFVDGNKRGTSLDLKRGLSATTWEWWKTQWGYRKTVQAYNEIPYHYKEMLAQNFGQDCVVASFSDCLYVPAQYKNEYIELATLLAKHDVFLEIAFPTILSCLSLKSEWVWLNGNLTNNQLARFTMEMDGGPCLLNHPVKLSYAANRSFVTNLFNTVKRINSAKV
jgi:hypothetical protein